MRKQFIQLILASLCFMSLAHGYSSKEMPTVFTELIYKQCVTDIEDQLKTNTQMQQIKAQDPQYPNDYCRCHVDNIFTYLSKDEMATYMGLSAKQEGGGKITKDDLATWSVLDRKIEPYNLKCMGFED